MRKELSPEFLTNNVILGVRMLSGVWEAWGIYLWLLGMHFSSQARSTTSLPTALSPKPGVFRFKVLSRT